MASQVEVPKKKAPPPIDVLARKIEALKNDASEKLKTAEPKITRLSERIKVLGNSREQHLEELTKINEEFEKILEELEIKNFLERFEASEKIAQFLQKNPNKKIEDLKLTDFSEIEILQNSEDWKNVLEDVKFGLKTQKKGSNVLASLKKNNSVDAKKQLEKSVEGRGVLEIAKKNPILLGVFLLASGAAIYEFFKKDSKLRDKIGGVAALGVGGLLGISLLKENFGSSMISLFGRKIIGEKNWKRVEQFFGEKEEKEKTKQTPKEIKKYGEMRPLSEAIGYYRKDAEDALRPIITLVKRRKDALAILSAAGFASSETVRNLTLDMAKMTAESAFTLAKLPLKAVHGFPLTSLFAATGLLLGFARIKKDVGEFKVPKNSENMLKFLKAKIKDSGEQLKGLNIPVIPDAHLPIIAGILTREKELSEFIAPAKEMLFGLAEVGTEKIELTPKKLIKKRNLTSLESFYEMIKGIKKPESATALVIVETLQKKVKNDEPISSTDIEKIKDAVISLDFEIRAEDGRLKSVILDENGVAYVQSICIDPSLSADKQFKIAQTFFVESNNLVDAVGKSIEIPFEQLRLALGNLREDIKTETEIGEVIERKLKEGWVLTIIGGTLSLVGKAGEKYILGGAEMIYNSNLLSGKEKFSCVEMAIEYAEGILPIAVIGTASALLRGDWKAFSPGRVLFRTAFYPFVGTKRVLSHIFRPLVDRNFSAIFTNPAIEFTSTFNEFRHNWQAKLSWLKELARTKKHKISALHSDIRDLNRAKKLIAEANGSFGTTKRRKLISEAREIFCDTEVKKNIFGKKNVNSIEKEPADIRETIKKTEAIIKEKKAEIKKIRGKTNQSNILRKPETTEIKEYLSWCEKNGVKPVATKVIKKRLATFGRGALRLGATPLMIFLTIHNIESAPPEKRNEAIAENAASLASFYIALKFGTAAFKTIPGPLLNKAVGSVSVAMLSFFVGQKSIDEFSSKILKKINLDFSEGSATDDVLLGLETVFGLGGSLGFIKNLFHTGENAKQFLERDIPALFHKGEFISRFHYNSVGTWNKRIQKRISETTSLPKKSFLQTLLINNDWQKMEAAKLSQLEVKRNTSKDETRKQVELKIENQKKFLQRIGQYHETNFKNKTFIQEGQEKLLEQKTLVNTIKQ